MRSLVVAAVVLAASLAAAGPTLYKRLPSRSTSAEMIAAERAWTAAERERDPKRAHALWQTAALAFDRAANHGAGTDAAYAAVLAWKNVLQLAPPDADTDADPSKPRAFDATQQALFDSLGRYLPLAHADEAPGIAFLRANMLRRHGRYGEAAPMFAELVTKHPEHEVAEYSANLLLDMLNREAKYDELAAWVDTMRASAKLLAGRAELVDLLDRLHVQVLRKRAEALELAGQRGDATGFARCAATYRDAARTHPHDARVDELLYNAGVCFERAGAKADARTAYREVAAMSKSKLATPARRRADELK